jgi:hypothetical protein
MRAASLTSPELLAFFRNLADEGDRRFAPMLSVLVRLATKPYADDLPAGTSHHALVIGIGRERISIEFDPSDGLFRVRYVVDTSGRGTTRVCPFDGVESLVDAFVLRLDVTRRTHPTEVDRGD